MGGTAGHGRSIRGHCRCTVVRKTLGTLGLLSRLVRDGEDVRRHFDAEEPSCLKVDDELELGGLQDRQIRRLGALEKAAGIDADLTPTFR